MCFDEPLDCSINEDELKIMSFNEILDTEFNRKSAVIDGLLYRGTYVLAGAPKSGKSFLAEQIAFHVATGTPLWNYEVRQGTVLYLALEDTYKRLQTRLYRMFRTSEAKNLYFATYAHSLDNGLLDSLNLFIDKHGDTSLIIIDTLQKVKEASNNYSYSKDYEVISALKQFADTRGCCLLLIHHTRKQKADDVFEMISGTNGILGSADGAMILNKANRTDTSAILSVSGRDQADMRIKLKRNPNTLAWNMVAVEQEVYEESNDPIIEAIARFVNDNQPQWSGTATELTDLLSLNMKPNALSRHLNVHSLDLIEKHIHYSTSRSHTGRKITLNYENNSNEAEKHVSLYLQPKLIDLIKKLKAEQAEQARLCGDLWHPSDRLFTNWNGKALNPGMPYKWLRRLCEDENLVFKGLHSFRHFVATKALANGVDAKAVSSLLGHSQTSTTLNIYAHVVQKSNEKALNSVAGLLEKPNNEHDNEHGGF